MFQLMIPGKELWDEKKEVFVHTKDTALCLEHSLVSLSKWEAKWHKPFLGKGEKSPEETLDYVRCMTLTQNVSPFVYDWIDENAMKRVSDYIADPMTATWFSKEDKSPPGREVVTAEVVYYWMIALNIPFECQKWHLNRLLTLIRVCNAKSAAPKKLGKKQLAKRNAALNAARRKNLGSRG
ncbi:MAG: hypothetical protein HFI81_10080 [Eubacterium sp.]|jgi:hypothetical protein|nr:hypothetical protein [Eubacterium sp.]